MALEGVATEYIEDTHLENNIYERKTIEIKLQSITLDQLIQFLLKIESSELTIGIRRLEIKRGIRDSSLLETTVQLVSLSTIQSN